MPPVKKKIKNCWSFKLQGVNGIFCVICSTCFERHMNSTQRGGINNNTHTHTHSHKWEQCAHRQTFWIKHERTVLLLFFNPISQPFSLFFPPNLKVSRNLLVVTKITVFPGFHNMQEVLKSNCLWHWSCKFVNDWWMYYDDQHPT